MTAVLLGVCLVLGLTLWATLLRLRDAEDSLVRMTREKDAWRLKTQP